MSLTANLIDATERGLLSANSRTLREVVHAIDYAYPQSDVEQALIYLVKTSAARVAETDTGRAWSRTSEASAV